MKEKPIKTESRPFEIGIYSFAELTPDSGAAAALTPAERLENLIEEIELADQVGLDVFGVGEHHRSEYLASAPVVILAAAARRTQRIRLSSAVTVLSSDDPVRVFQDFATLDLLSGGRAEIMVGRGSFIESFPLFGFDLDDYDELFAEKLDLLLRLRASERVTWSGRHRPPLDDRAVYPRPLQHLLPLWVAVGGTPASAHRAGTLGLPLAVGIIGGMPERFAPLVHLYREAARKAGHDPSALPVSINSHGFLAASAEEAAQASYAPFLTTMNRIGRERGWSPMTLQDLEAQRSLRGALVTGSAEEVVEKILFQQRIFGHDRFLIQLTVGSIPHESVLRAIELLGTEVAPLVRKEVAGR